jgi:hypothetical protein
VHTVTSKERIRAAIDHHEPDRVPVDFGSTFITGIHCTLVAALREHFELERRLVRVCEPYQMLGWVEDDLLDALGADVISIFPRHTIFGFPNERWKTWCCPWGQEVLVSEHFRTLEKDDGTYIFPKGDISAPPSGHMPRGGWFFDAIIRQPPIAEGHLDPTENLEEFTLMDDAAIAYWGAEAERLRGSSRAVITHLNGTGLGDIALVPAPFLTHPRGIRDIAEWYMATAAHPEYVNEVFARQTEIALKNLATLHATVGEVIDVVVVCGTDFGTQESSFCSPATFDRLWLPHYRRMNDWIHTHTTWKTFKHSCGAVEPFIPHFVEAGFDILNPVQCSARGMAPEILKERHGDRITFWGGGVNTQHTLPFGSPSEVRAEVLRRCEVFAPSGGFVFNTIHNVQAGTPVANVVAMVDAIREFNGNRR